MSARRALPALALPAALLLVAVYALPMLGLGRMSFNEVAPGGAMQEAWSLAIWRDLFADPFTGELTLNALWLSLMATLIGLTLAYPVALFLFRTTSRFRGLLAVIAVAPMLVSSVVRVFGWLAILSDRGLINWALQSAHLASAPVRLLYNWIGVTIGLTESIMPYMILTLIAGFGRLDRTVEEAAASLGAPPWRVLLRVTLPLSAPALLTAAIFGFVLSMSAFITPKLLGGGRVFVLATEIYEQAVTNTNWPLAAALALYTLLLLLTLLGAYGAITRSAAR